MNSTSPAGWAKWSFVKGDRGALRTGFHAVNARVTAELFDRDDPQQIIHFFGQGAEAIDELRRVGVYLGTVFEACQAPVQAQPHVEVRNIPLRYQHGGADTYLR